MAKAEQKKVSAEKLAKAKEVLNRMNVIDFPVPNITKGMSEEDHRESVEMIVSALLIEMSSQKRDGERQAQVLYDFYEEITGEEFDGDISEEVIEKVTDFFTNIPDSLLILMNSSLQEKSLLYKSSMMQNMNELIKSLQSILQIQTDTGQSIQTSENEE